MEIKIYHVVLRFQFFLGWKIKGTKLMLRKKFNSWSERKIENVQLVQVLESDWEKILSFHLLSLSSHRMKCFTRQKNVLRLILADGNIDAKIEGLEL